MKQFEENAREFDHSYNNSMLMAKDRSHFIKVIGRDGDDKFVVIHYQPNGKKEKRRRSYRYLVNNYRLGGYDSTYIQDGPFAFYLCKNIDRQFSKGINANSYATYAYTDHHLTRRYLSNKNVKMPGTRQQELLSPGQLKALIKGKFSTFAAAFKRLVSAKEKVYSIALSPAYCMGLEVSVNQPLLYHKGKPIGLCSENQVNLFNDFNYMKEALRRDLHVGSK